MPGFPETQVVKTIGLSGCDYASIQAFLEDAANRNNPENDTWIGVLTANVTESPQLVLNINRPALKNVVITVAGNTQVIWKNDPGRWWLIDIYPFNIDNATVENFMIDPTFSYTGRPSSNDTLIIQTNNRRINSVLAIHEYSGISITVGGEIALKNITFISTQDWYISTYINIGPLDSGTIKQGSSINIVNCKGLDVYGGDSLITLPPTDFSQTINILQNEIRLLGNQDSPAHLISPLDNNRALSQLGVVNVERNKFLNIQYSSIYIILKDATFNFINNLLTPSPAHSVYDNCKYVRCLIQHDSATVHWYFNTIVSKNATNNLGNGYVIDGGTFLLRNIHLKNNIAYNLYTGFLFSGSNTDNITARHCHAYGCNTPINPLNYNPQNLSTWVSSNVDPQFVDPDNDDYHLKPSSQDIDHGSDPDDTFYSSIPTDLDGNSRLSGSNYDIGCYEYQIPQFERKLSYRSLSALAGRCPVSIRTSPRNFFNNQFESISQPEGTAFIPFGADLSSLNLNRPLAALANNIDAITGTLTAARPVLNCIYIPASMIGSDIYLKINYPIILPENKNDLGKYLILISERYNKIIHVTNIQRLDHQSPGGQDEQQYQDIYNANNVIDESSYKLPFISYIYSINKSIIDIVTIEPIPVLKLIPGIIAKISGFKGDSTQANGYYLINKIKVPPPATTRHYLYLGPKISNLYRTDGSLIKYTDPELDLESSNSIYEKFQYGNVDLLTIPEGQDPTKITIELYTQRQTIYRPYLYRLSFESDLEDETGAYLYFYEARPFIRDFNSERIFEKNYINLMKLSSQFGIQELTVDIDRDEQNNILQAVISVDLAEGRFINAKLVPSIDIESGNDFRITIQQVFNNQINVAMNALIFGIYPYGTSGNLRIEAIEPMTDDNNNGLIHVFVKNEGEQINTNIPIYFQFYVY
jgi:hypothetical protein